jgi:hypothetical protein
MSDEEDTKIAEPGPAPEPKKADKKAAAKAKGKAAGKGKGKGNDKGKGKSKGKGKKGAGDGLSIASNPRAAAQVRRAKGWGGLFGFALAAYFSYRAGVSLPQTGLRAIAAGAAGYMLAWACMVTIWRQLLLAEVRTMVEQRQSPAAIPSGAAPGPTDDQGKQKVPG